MIDVHRACRLQHVRRRPHDGYLAVATVGLAMAYSGLPGQQP